MIAKINESFIFTIILLYPTISIIVIISVRRPLPDKHIVSRIYYWKNIMLVKILKNIMDKTIL